VPVKCIRPPGKENSFHHHQGLLDRGGAGIFELGRQRASLITVGLRCEVCKAHLPTACWKLGGSGGMPPLPGKFFKNRC